MVFAYYNRLSRDQKRVYRQSDQIAAIALPKVNFRPFVERLAEALESEDRRAVESACQRLAAALAASLKIGPVLVGVLAVRPSKSWGELHGLYTLRRKGRSARITVWMRTARRRQVVAFRTFLRTLLHELCHHLDYELLGLSESFHTEGFYKRESSLFHQLVEQGSWAGVGR